MLNLCFRSAACRKARPVIIRFPISVNASRADKKNVDPGGKPAIEPPLKKYLLDLIRGEPFSKRLDVQASVNAAGERAVIDRLTMLRVRRSTPVVASTRAPKQNSVDNPAIVRVEFIGPCNGL